MKKKRTYNTKLIKSGCSYEIEDVAELLDGHINTVHNWIKGGLPSMKAKKPFLIHGSELIAFLNDKQRKRKHPCSPEEIFCFTCQVPRKPKEGKVEVKIRNKNQLTLIGDCEHCGNRIFRGGATRKLSEYGKFFKIQTIHNQHLIERS